MMALTMELAAEAGVRQACHSLAVPRASYYRHQSPGPEADAPVRERAPSPRALGADE